MKNLILLLLLCAGFLFSCKKETTFGCAPVVYPPIDTIDTIPVNPDTTWAELFRNGLLWDKLKYSGNFHKITDSTFTTSSCYLEFYEFYQTIPAIRRRLRIWKLPTAVGKYPISFDANEVNARYTIYDVDVPEDTYKVDTTVMDNFIEITEYDSLSHFMKGKFNCSLYLTGGLTNPANPTYVEFKNCTFRIKLEF